MFSAETFGRLVAYAIDAHANRARRPENAYRKMDGATPYASHPIWCAMAILAEPMLHEGLREKGARILLFHDLLEDTSAPLPPDTPTEVRKGVEGMTFPGGAEEEIASVWGRGELVILLKLYDKTHGLLDRQLSPPPKRRRNADYAMRLCEAVERRHGKLNITILCRALCADVR